jgi:hypothetical protein
VDPDKGEWVGADKTERRFVSRQCDFIMGYEVRYVEAHERLFDHPMDISLKDLSIDERIEVANEAELAELLQRWLTDLSVLRPPDVVGYWGFGY